MIQYIKKINTYNYIKKKYIKKLTIVKQLHKRNH